MSDQGWALCRSWRVRFLRVLASQAAPRYTGVLRARFAGSLSLFNLVTNACESDVGYIQYLLQLISLLL